MNFKTVTLLTKGRTYSVSGGIQLTTVLLFLLLFTLSASIAGASVSTIAHYKVSSKGFTIGDVTTTQRTSEDGGCFGSA
jgi:hypothetical protein